METHHRVRAGRTGRVGGGDSLLGEAMKAVYTTGQAAKICRLSVQTINRLCDSKHIISYRIPGSQHRRIPKRDLMQFMRDSDMPLEWLPEVDAG